MSWRKELLLFKNIGKERLTDKHFIEKVVNEEVVEFNLATGSKNGDNFMGCLTAIDVKTKSGEIHRLLYKGLNYQEESQTVFTVALQFFWKENLFYKYIAPEMVKMTPPTQKTPFARMYDCHNDDKTDFIVLQDMRPLGFKMPNKFPGLSLEETTMVLKELGAFHARGYNLIKDKGEDLYSGDRHRLIISTFIGRKEYSNSHFAGYNLICGKLSSILKNKRNFALAHKLDKLTPKLIDLIIIPWRLANEGKYFPVISHGDLWSNNILFRYDEQGQPLEVKFIDFQQTSRTTIYADLYYFIYCSTSPDFRKKHMKTVLDVYYDAFVNELSRIGSPEIPDFTRQKFEHDFFENAIAAIAYCVFAVPFHLGTFPKNDDDSIIEEPEKTNGKSENKAEETINDLVQFLCEGTKGLSEYLAVIYENSDRALDRMQDLIVEFVDLGIL